MKSCSQVILATSTVTCACGAVIRTNTNKALVKKQTNFHGPPHRSNDAIPQMQQARYLTHKSLSFSRSLGFVAAERVGYHLEKVQLMETIHDDVTQICCPSHARGDAANS